VADFGGWKPIISISKLNICVNLFVGFSLCIYSLLFIHVFMYVMYIQQTVDSSIMFGNSAGVTICASVDKALGARRAAAAGHAGDEEGGRAQSPQLGGELFEEKGAALVMVGEVFQCFFYGSAGQTHIFLGG
jgi:hypothetical protein